MVLRTLTRIHDLEESPDPHVEGVTLDSADGHFRIELLVEGQSRPRCRALLLDLMAENPLGFSRLMEALRWELPSELEGDGAPLPLGATLGPGLPRPRVGGPGCIPRSPSPGHPRRRPARWPALGGRARS